MDPDEERQDLERFAAQMKYLNGLVNTFGVIFTVLLVLMLAVLVGWLK